MSIALSITCNDLAKCLLRTTQQSSSFIGNVIKPKLLCCKRLDGMGFIFFGLVEEALEAKARMDLPINGN